MPRRGTRICRIAMCVMRPCPLSARIEGTCDKVTCSTYGVLGALIKHAPEIVADVCVKLGGI